MSSLDEKQLLRIENFFKRQEKLYSAKREKSFLYHYPNIRYKKLNKNNYRNTFYQKFIWLEKLS